MTWVERLLTAIWTLGAAVACRRTRLVALYTATLVVMAVMWLISIPHLATYTAIPILDVRTEAYGLDAAKAYLDALGDAGRSEYLGVQLRLDGIFPFLYGATLAHLLGLVLGRAGLAPKSALIVALLVVVPTCILDLMENDAIATLLRAGPTQITESQVASTVAFTLAKWSVAKLAIAFAFAAAAMALWTFRKEQQR